MTARTERANRWAALFWLALASGACIFTRWLASTPGAGPLLSTAFALGAGLAALVVGGCCCAAGGWDRRRGAK